MEFKMILESARDKGKKICGKIYKTLTGTSKNLHLTLLWLIPCNKPNDLIVNLNID